MHARKNSLPSWRSWNGLVYYGETFGFVAAWIAGVSAIAYSASRQPAEQPAIDRVASVQAAPGEL